MVSMASLSIWSSKPLKQTASRVASGLPALTGQARLSRQKRQRFLREPLPFLYLMPEAGASSSCQELSPLTSGHKKGRPRKVARSKRVPVDPSWIALLSAVPALHDILSFGAHRHAWRALQHCSRSCPTAMPVSADICLSCCPAHALPGVLPVPLPACAADSLTTFLVRPSLSWLPAT